MSDILTGFNMQGNDPIDDRIVSKSILETLEEYLKRVPVQKRYYGLTFFALDKDNKLRQYTFQTSLIEPTIDDSDDRLDKLQENIDNVDKDLQDHKNNKSIHKTSEEIRSEIVDADIPDSIAREQWVIQSIGVAIENIVAGASTDYDTLKKVQTKIEDLRSEMESQLYGDDGSGIFKTLEQVLGFLNQYKDFIVDIPTNFVSKHDIIDNLTTDDAVKVLSARQGKILSETLTNYFDSAMQSIRSETDRATNAENRIEAKLDAEIERSTNKDENHDSRLNALEGKSHTQNTDLGTTNSTFQLKYNTGNKIKHESDAISVRNSADTDYVNFIANNATFKGDLLVEGKSFVTEAETVEIKDNLLLLNKGEVGSGVTKGMAGLEIDRGTEPNYQIVFDESDNRFKAGEIGDIQCLALRDGDDSMTGGMFTSWDATTKRLKTTNIVPEDRELIFSGPKTVSLFYSDIYEGLALSKMGDGSFIAISPSSAEIKIDSKPDDIYYSGNIKADSFVRSTDKSPALHEADLVNDLTTGGANKPLTAEQGKVLKSSIDGLSTDLSKYALLAGNNTFSGSNTFALNKFQVGTGSLFRVNADTNLIVNSIVTGGWNKELVYYSRESSSSTAVKRGAFGIKADGATEPLDTDYLYLSVGEANWRSAQYKFQANKLIVPSTWSLRTSSSFNLIKVDDVNEVGFGSNSIPNCLVSNNTDITHRKYTATSTYTDYKIYDSYNLPNPVQTSDLASYLPLAGGTLTGDLVLSNNNYIKGIVSTGTPIQILGLNSSNTISIGNGSYNLLLYTGASDISHWKGGTSYKIWDASNVSRPLNYVNGTAGSVTSVYTRNLNLNGTNYPFIGTGTSVVTLFAPTTAGTSGQVLQSQGAGKAPIWVDGGTGGGVQLSDTNVWTGLNTFQGGLKTSDGTNTYDVWANDILKYPVKYEINSIGNYNFNYYTKTAGWRRIDQVAINNILPDTITSLTNGGYGTLGLGTNAYMSAAIADILTNSIYFEGLNARVLSTNSDGDLEYGSTTNYGDFNSRNIRIAYPMSSGSGGSGGGSSTTYEGGLTIGYYPVNTKGTVTERAKIYCTTSNLYLKDLAKNTQLDFDTDGLYVTTGSSSKVRLATLNDISGSGSSVSLDGNNTWTGVNIFSGTTLVTNQYDSGNTEIPSSAKYSIRLACGGSYNEYGFGAIRTEDRTKQSYSFVQTPSAFFIFDNSGSLYTTIGNTKYEFWNKNNLAKPITYNTNTEGNAILYKGDSASKIDGLVLLAMMPDDSTPNILQGGTGGFGSAEHAYASCHIGAVYTNEIHTYIDNDMTATVNLTMDDNGVYFAKSDGTLYKLMMEAIS